MAAEKRLEPQKILKRESSCSRQGQMAGLYDLEETLGKGHFAVVKAARHVFTGERVAVKVIDKSKLDANSQKSLLKEVLCMKLVQHPNVVRLYQVIDTSNKLYLILELGKGDLYDLITNFKGLDEGTARHYFTQIVAAVSYCHKLHVVHRDLKPENVVYFPCTSRKNGMSSGLAGGQVKLTDFGFSNNYCPGVKLDTSCGSLAYSAPEILLGDSYDPPAVDIWSLGVILYMLVVGHPPFQEANDSETLTMIMDVKYSIPNAVSPDCRDLIEKMLQKSPEKRATLHQIQTHPWFSNKAMDPPLISVYNLSVEERNEIIQQMIDGKVVDSKEIVIESLSSNAYNYITSTFYLLAEKLLRERQSSAELRRRSSIDLEKKPELLTVEHRKNSISLSTSCSTGFKQKLVTQSEDDEEEPQNSPPPSPKLQRNKSEELAENLEEENLTRRSSSDKEKKQKKKSWFNWLFNKKNNNNNRIYKTKSCSEIKLV